MRYLAGSMGTTKGFTGQYGDSVSGLDYYHARYYDPVVGLFLSADKVQGNPQGLDSYSYVGDNPETHTDPTGQRVMCEQDCGSGGNDPTPPPPPPTGHKQGSGPVGPCGPSDDCNSPPPNCQQQGTCSGNGNNHHRNHPGPKIKLDGGCDSACRDNRVKQALEGYFNNRDGMYSLLLDAFSLLSDIGNIFSIRTIFLFGGIGVILQSIQTIAHTIHFIVDVFALLNKGVVPSWLVPALAISNGMSIAANLLNTLWMGSAWLLGAQGLLTGLAAPEISTMALGATALAVGAQLGINIVQTILDARKASESQVLNNWSPEQRSQYCAQQLGVASC